VYRYIRRGKLAASRLGRTYRIRRESVDRLLLVTRSPASISVRRYSKAQLMTFVQDDQLDEATGALADRFIEVAEAKATDRFTVGARPVADHLMHGMTRCGYKTGLERRGLGRPPIEGHTGVPRSAQESALYSATTPTISPCAVVARLSCLAPGNILPGFMMPCGSKTVRSLRIWAMSASENM